MRPATAPPAQLVQLGDAEAIRVPDHHHRRVRHVDADLDDRGGDQHVDVTADERAHHLLLLLAGQLAVQDAQAHPGQGAAAQVVGQLEDAEAVAATIADHLGLEG